MVKTCQVKVDKETYTVNYDTDEYEKLICEVSVFAKEGRNASAKVRNAFKCIHCKAKFTSKQRLNYHRLKGCDKAFDINGKPLELKPYPSVTSGQAVAVRDILEKNNLYVRNTFKCIHCNKECLSKQRLNYHCRMGCPGVLDINDQPVQLKLLPSVPSGGAVEPRYISEKPNLQGVCEPEERDQLADFGEDVIPHGSPLQLLWEDGSKLPDVLCVTPIVYKEHPESHEVSFLVMDGLSFSPVFVYQKELEKEDLRIYQEKGLFDFLRQKANRALCVASVPEREECISQTGLDPDLTVCTGFSCTKIYPVIVDRIVADNTRVVKIADVPSTIWATITGFAMARKRVLNIIIMGCHEDCTRSCEAEGERWISWEGAGSLEGHMKSLTPQEQQVYVMWVPDLLRNCSNVIKSRRGLMPKSVLPSSFPSVSNSLDRSQDMHNFKVLVTQPAKSQDSSERCKRKSLANGSPGNSSGNEDIINITRQQQVKLLTFTSISLCS